MMSEALFLFSGGETRKYAGPPRETQRYPAFAQSHGIGELFLLLP